MVIADLIKDKLPRVMAHFEKLDFPLEPLTINWFLCLFINAIPLETTLRVWDVMFHEGSKVLFRVALALLYENVSVFCNGSARLELNWCFESIMSGFIQENQSEDYHESSVDGPVDDASEGLSRFS